MTESDRVVIGSVYRVCANDHRRMAEAPACEINEQTVPRRPRGCRLDAQEMRQASG
jgi:hypothetical protein